tara:strand:+ start:5153 stop:5569 length:417 start_codon:yes stop_codon:yes gene_type:complete
MDENAIIINLKVIASIQPNDKINTGDKYLNLERVSFVPLAVKRWWRADDRNESLTRIDQIVTEALAMDNHIVETNVKDSISGLNNFKKTYSKCRQSIARIDTIIEKINQKYNSQQYNSQQYNEDEDEEEDEDNEDTII